jgi:general secretion pathway protein L
VSAASSAFETLSRWIDDVTAGLTRIGSALRRRRTIELVEQPDGSFLALERRNGATRPLSEPPLRFGEDGFATGKTPLLSDLLPRSLVDVELAPSRFVFRTLELPLGADQFLEGIVRSQIDRLTPWSANDAAFGWGAAREIAPNRIAVTVAATAQARVAPIAKALIAERAHGVRMSTRLTDEDAIVRVFTQQSHRAGDQRLRQGILIAVGAAGLTCLVGLGAWLIVGSVYDARDRTLREEIARYRAELLQGRDAAGRSVQAIEERKRTTPSAVIALEELSKALPDDAHLTELSIEDGKIEIIGVARDASALIPLIEQSSQFTEATFVAATTRGPNGGEIFHIEARLQPSFVSRN